MPQNRVQLILEVVLVMHYILGLTHLDSMNQAELMEKSHFGLHRCSNHLKTHPYTENQETAEYNIHSSLYKLGSQKQKHQWLAKIMRN